MRRKAFHLLLAAALLAAACTGFPFSRLLDKMLFDRLAASDFDLARTAALCGVSVSRLERTIRKYPQLWRSCSEEQMRIKQNGSLPD